MKVSWILDSAPLEMGIGLKLVGVVNKSQKITKIMSVMTLYQIPTICTEILGIEAMNLALPFEHFRIFYIRTFSSA